MTIGPLTIANRMHCNGEPTNGWVIASWHWPWSLTWSWGLDWSPHCTHSGARPAFYIKTNDGFICGVRIPVIGDIFLQTQAVMKR